MSLKTKTKDKDIHVNPGNIEEDQNRVGGKPGKEKKDDNKRRTKKKYYEGESRKHRLKKHEWDFMMQTRDDDQKESHSDNDWGKWDARIKIIVCAFISIIVLATAITSKLCLVLITANVLPPKKGVDDMSNMNLYFRQKTANFSFIYNDNETNVQWIWALVLVISAPYIFTIVASVWKILLRRKIWGSSWNGFPKVIIQETIHSTGLCLMAFVLLPNVDPIAGILVCFHVAVIPSFTGLFQRFSDGLHHVRWRVMHVVALVLQLAAIGFSCGYYVTENKTETRILQILTICLAPVFVSIYWWENYFVFHKNKYGIETKGTVQTDPHESRTNSDSVAEKKLNYLGCLSHLWTDTSEEKINFDILVHLWKIIITIFVPICLFGLPCPSVSECMGTLFGSTLNSAFDNGVGKTELSSRTYFKDCSNNVPFIIAAIGILCSGACYKALKLGCQIVAQIPCVSITLTLSSPLTMAVLFWILENKLNLCSFSYKSENLLKYLQSSSYWMVIVSGICGYLSLGIICWHIWIPDNRRLKKSKELFAKPLYCGVLFEQSIRLNIIRMWTDKNDNRESENENIQNTDTGFNVSTSGENPKLYLCATMWHETKSEMTKLIRSILRLDEDHMRISTMKKETGFFTEDFFSFEVHIFFDDAFEALKDEDGKEEIVLNQYVKNLIEVVRDVTENKIQPFTKCRTKYGGQLKWILPYDNVMFAHLKHKNLIRRKKRWSQVMYMYYFLGHQFVEQMKDTKQEITNMDNILPTIAENSALREKIENTFILALDGDVDFQPEAVKYLLDRMRKEKRIGAACGRIHPTGNGPIVWYQKFEYAVSHWLQKAAEDVLGCVLCSPGCFSLFRGSALVDSNVMKLYTTYPTESWHHVQYDQGEDRWLCTLLLQQGYKVEYVAASDAYTEAPEGFNEFLNQRRRWSPSTMANILDLIMDWKHVVKFNPYICRLYIFYQAFLMFTSILTPGMILLMIVGALTTAFSALPLWVALLLTILPVAVFIAICFNARTETQLKFAVILSIAYALVMMIVMVGLVVHMVRDGLCSITTIFLIYVAGIFLISALLHIKEFKCVLHGFLYFIAIPCSSLIMMLYALCNLNITSWGTRETTPQKDSKQGNPHKRSKGLDSSQGIGSIFRCFLCSEDSNMQFLSDRLDAFEKRLSSNTKETVEELEKTRMDETAIQLENALQTTRASEGDVTAISDKVKEREEHNTDNDEPFTSRAWTNDRLLLDTRYERQNKTEKTFWKDMIRRYLFPVEQTDEEKRKIEHDLTVLRNKVCLFFILANALFITIIFALQQIAKDSESKSLSVPLPCPTQLNVTTYVEPISLAFTFVFGIILLVQFICMLFHRLDTLIHICARTKIFMEQDSDQDNQNMRRLYADIKKTVRKKQTEKRNFVRRVLHTNTVSPSSESETSKPNSAQMNWRKARKIFTAMHRNKKDSAMKMFCEQINLVKTYAKQLQVEMGKGADKQEVIKKIKDKFPTFTTEAHHAIYTLYVGNIDLNSQNAKAVKGDAQNDSGQVQSESP